MAEQKKVRETFATPKATLKWATLGKPDTKYKAEGEYRVTLALPKDAPETVAFLEKLDAAHAVAIDEVKAQLASDPKTRAKAKTLKATNLPYKPEKDQEGNETNNVLVSFKAKASGKRKDGTVWKFRPFVFDAKKNPIPEATMVWGGSVGRVSYQMDCYYVAASQEAGLSLKLQAVQITVLKTGGNGKDAAAFGFEEEEGYTEAEEVTQAGAAETPADGGDF